MKANNNNLQKNRFENHKKIYLREHNHNNEQANEYTNKRPTKALSFGGSWTKMGSNIGDKFIESSRINKMIKFTQENEAAYNAVYSLIFAGILKPAAIISKTKKDKKDGADKDGVMIAAKNFLQAFIGSFLGLTIGGGFVKKIWDKLSNNLKLFKLDEKGNITTAKASDKSARSISKKAIEKEENSIKNKFIQAKANFKSGNGILKFRDYITTFFKKINYTPQEDEINAKAKEIVNNFNKNHKKIFEKNPKYLKKLVENMQKLDKNPCSAKHELKKGSQLFDSFESVWKNSTGLPTTIAKAKLSTLLLPTVAAFIMAKRNLEDKKEENKPQDLALSNSAVSKERKELFSKFLNNDKNNSQVNFTGLIDTAIDKTTAVVEKGAMSKIGEWLVNFFAKTKQPSARIADFESAGLTGYWLQNTIFSKRIDPEQKLGLNVHTVLVTIVASICALLVDSITNPLVNKSENNYLNRIKDTALKVMEETKNGADEYKIKKIIKKNISKLYNSEEVNNFLSDKKILSLNEKELNSKLEGFAYKYSKRLSKLKSLTVFTLVVRFLVPVLTVDISKKVKKKLLEWSSKKDKNENKEKIKKS